MARRGSPENKATLEYTDDDGTKVKKERTLDPELLAKIEGKEPEPPLEEEQPYFSPQAIRMSEISEQISQDQGKVKVSRLNRNTGKDEYLDDMALTDLDPASPESTLKARWPDGGEFKLEWIDPLNEAPKSRRFSIARPVTENSSSVPYLAPPPAPVPATGNSQIDSFLQYMMQSQQNDRLRLEKQLEMERERQAKQEERMANLQMENNKLLVEAIKGSNRDPLQLKDIAATMAAIKEMFKSDSTSSLKELLTLRKTFEVMNDLQGSGTDENPWIKEALRNPYIGPKVAALMDTLIPGGAGARAGMVPAGTGGAKVPTGEGENGVEHPQITDQEIQLMLQNFEQVWLPSMYEGADNDTMHPHQMKIMLIRHFGIGAMALIPHIGLKAEDLEAGKLDGFFMKYPEVSSSPYRIHWFKGLFYFLTHPAAPPEDWEPLEDEEDLEPEEQRQ